VQVAGDGRGCDTDTGAFTVRQAVFSGSVLEHFEYGNVSAPSQLFVTG
jgi:hypothetical protein